MNTFKILLVLDNLETVLDEHVRSFLSQITSSSKVLITSRIGLEELEYRFPVHRLKIENAVALLRSIEKVRQVDQLVRTDNRILREYCIKMEKNPLFIKWFVSCVQSGRRPDEVLQNTDIFFGILL